MHPLWPIGCELNQSMLLQSLDEMTAWLLIVLWNFNAISKNNT
jgi:hypothetical protein